MNPKARKKYPKDFKQEAVRLVDQIGAPAAAEKLGLPVGRLYAWKRSLAEEGPEAFRGQGTRPALEAELSRLRREVNDLRAERDILKKAATYFARTSK